MNKKIIAFISAIVLTILAGTVALVHAQPSEFLPTISTATATSTIVYFTPGGASSGTTSATLVYDAYSTNQPLKADQASLLVQENASSTASKFNINLQYSQDGIDWYGDFISPDLTLAATSSIGLTANIYNVASTTYQFISAQTGVQNFIIPIKTPLRYVRAVFTEIAATSSLWVSIVPFRQQSQ